VRDELLDGDAELRSGLGGCQQTVRITDRLRLGLLVETEQLAQAITLALFLLPLFGRRTVTRCLHRDGTRIALRDSPCASRPQYPDQLCAISHGCGDALRVRDKHDLGRVSVKRAHRPTPFIHVVTAHTRKLAENRALRRLVWLHAVNYHDVVPGLIQAPAGRHSSSPAAHFLEQGIENPRG
jgi:hypothetical protein